MTMSILRRRALARLARTEDEAQRLYDGSCPLDTPIDRRLYDLCESHERLRAHMRAAETRLEETQCGILSLVRVMDGIAATGGHEEQFRYCRDLLHALLYDGGDDTP